MDEGVTVVYSEKLGLYRCTVLGRNEHQALIRVEGTRRPMSVPTSLVFELENGQTWRDGEIVEDSNDT
jgi:hypothetical protein